MNREGALGLLLVALLLGGIVLFARRPAVTTSAPRQLTQGNIKVLPVQAEPRHYQNKEIREIEYNEDKLPVRFVITRDYTIT